MHLHILAVTLTLYSQSAAPDVIRLGQHMMGTVNNQTCNRLAHT